MPLGFSARAYWVTMNLTGLFYVAVIAAIVRG